MLLLYIYAINKYATKMSCICQTPKLMNVHRWTKYANIYVSHKLTGINHVMRNAVQKDNNAYTDNEDNAALLHQLSWTVATSAKSFGLYGSLQTQKHTDKQIDVSWIIFSKTEQINC